MIEEEIPGLQAGPNKIPFLAGQDWLLMMKAVIDIIGANEVEFKALGVRAPLHVDTSGHLTVAIDEFPVGGWPPGLETRIDHYPGAVFVTAKTALDDKGKDPIVASSAYEKCDKQITGCPNYMYEPNDDNMNTNIPRGPCSVQPDFWEFDYVHGIIVRHHRRPRKELFDLATCPDGPLCEQLMSDRITVVNGLDKPLCDTWLRHASSKSSLKSSWTGCTYFFLLGTDLKKIKAPTSQCIGVEMVSSADGKTYTVHPSSLTLLQNKKILQFDLGGKAPIFEHVGTKKQVTFNVPPQQFGSKIVQSRKSTSRDAPSQAPSSMAASGLASSNAMIRELKHRGPALMGYMENILKEVEAGEPNSSTLPPSTTQAPGQTKRAITTGYPMHYTKCPHELESARRLGNCHGKFLECIQCGLVKKAFKEDYVLPITFEKVTIYGITHGLRDRPGGKIHPRIRDPEDSSTRLAACYSLSSRSAVEAPINKEDKKKHTKLAVPTSSTRESSRDWEKVNVISSDEDM